MLIFFKEKKKLNRRKILVRCPSQMKKNYIGGGSISYWIAYLLMDPAAQDLNHYYGFFSEKIVDITELIDRSALRRGRVDRTKSLIVDQTHQANLSVNATVNKKFKVKFCL